MKSNLLLSSAFLLMASVAVAETEFEKHLTGTSFPRAQLVPNGFSASAETAGDLNGDGIEDVALIVRKTSNAKSNNDEQYPPQYVIIFKGNKLGMYTMWKIGRSHFVNAHPGFIEPNGIGNFEIKKGVLTIGTALALSAGSWGAGGCNMKWRDDKKGFRLIGLTVVDFSRSCACGTTVDRNLLTGSKIITTNRSSSGEQLPTERMQRLKEKPKTLLWERFDYDESCK